MRRFCAATLAMLIPALASLQAAEREAASSLNGVWLRAEREGEGYAFLTIIHRDDEQLAIVSASRVSIPEEVVAAYRSETSLGRAELFQTGDDIGSAMSMPDLFRGADARFAIHRPSADELLLELTRCGAPENSVGAISCDTIYEQGFPLRERIRYRKVLPSGFNGGPPAGSGLNRNIDDPVLTVFDNAPIVPGGALRLVWSDEFDGARLDPETWFFESGDGSQYSIPGWGNDELQWYLPDNARIENGKLVITARRRQQGDFEYTSARINTRDRFAFRYGRIEARIRLPAGQGLWPAFWLLPQENAYGGWPASGEIDIMEAVNPGGSGGDAVHGTIHYGDALSGNRSSGGEHMVRGGVVGVFRDYAVEWGPRAIRWYADGELYAAEDEWFTAAADYPAPFDRPFHIILNLAVGGRFPGPPDATTNFPAAMEVDYVRVYSGAP